MSFTTAFLHSHGGEGIVADISHHLDQLLRAVTPDAKVPSHFLAIRSSNLCFGNDMRWALSDLGRNDAMSALFLERFIRFEPRISRLEQMELQEMPAHNRIHLSICARIGDKTERAWLEAQYVLLDQAREPKPR